MNFATGDALTLSLTPMIGAVIGRTAGVIPALEVGLEWKRLEGYAEAEYVLVSVGDEVGLFLHVGPNWGCGRPAGCGREGRPQRTRVHHADRDVQPGLLVGARRARVDGTVYVFSPGGDDAYTVVSVAISF